MLKLVVLPILLAAACIVAGLYGALHNQISYTVAPAYFHDYKFDQFDIPVDLRNRVGASVVGWHASWWMGLLIGVPVLIVGLILPGCKAYLSRCLLAFVVVALTALLAGLGALIYACVTISAPFDQAGAMHNFSYLGGFFGIITGTLYLIVERFRLASQRQFQGKVQ